MENRRQMILNNLKVCAGKWMECVCLLAVSMLFLTGIYKVYAEENQGIDQFLGFYLCGISEVEEYSNPEVMRLHFNDEGQFCRYSGMYYGTLGTNRYCNYSDYFIAGNILTCYYEEINSSYGTMEEEPAGMHQFVLTEEGNLIEENLIWYPYEIAESQTEDNESGVIMEVTDIDFTHGEFSQKASFLGNEKLSRESVEQVTFLSTLEDTPDDVWDVSKSQDGTVMAWTVYGSETDESMCHVYIAADGGVRSGSTLKNLFRYCTNLRKVDFGDEFDTSKAKSTAYMFCECTSLETLDLSGLDVPIVQEMTKMFYNCECLQELNICDFTFTGSTYGDIYTGTIWEGLSPAIKDNVRQMSLGYLLDVESVECWDSDLKAFLLDTYDDRMDELQMNNLYFREYAYVIKDLDDDKVPELMIHYEDSGRHYYDIYYFDPVSCRVVAAGNESIASDSNSLEYSEKDGTLCYYENDVYNVVKMSSGWFENVGTFSYEEMNFANYKKLNFRDAIPEKIEQKTVDLDGDGTTEQIDIYAIRDQYGYDYFGMYVDSKKMYSWQAKEKAEGCSLQTITFPDQPSLILVNIWDDYKMEYSDILKYSNGSTWKYCSFDDFINDSQLLTDYGMNCIADIRVSEEEVVPVPDINMSTETNGMAKEIVLTFTCNSLTFGPDLSFSLPYRYENGQLIQQQYMAEDISAYKWDYILECKKQVYNCIGERKEKLVFDEGSVIIPVCVWMSNGIIWVCMSDESEENWGWMPLNADTLFRDIYYVYGTSVLDRIDEFKDNDRFWNISLPDMSELYQLGVKYFEKEEYFYAMTYLDLIGKRSEYYKDAQQKLSVIEKWLESFPAEAETQDVIDSEENESSMAEMNEKRNEAEDARETFLNKAAREYIFSGQERTPAYSLADLDLDGTREVIIRYYTPEGTEGGRYLYDIYQYVLETKSFELLPEASFSTFAGDGLVHLMEEQGLLITDWSFADENDFLTFSLSDGTLNLQSESNDDLSYIPELAFKDLNYCWESKESSGSAEKIFEEFLQSGEKVLWDENTERLKKYAFFDLNGDGEKELILQGTGAQFNFGFSIYTWDEQNHLVKYITTLEAPYDILSYSPGFHAFATFSRASDFARYTYYTMTENEIKEEFMASNFTDKVTYWYSYQRSTDIDKTIIAETKFEEAHSEIWEEYTGDFQTIEFLENNFDHNAENMENVFELYDDERLNTAITSIGLPYLGNQVIETNLQNLSGKIVNAHFEQEGILGYAAQDFDGDGRTEILAVVFGDAEGWSNGYGKTMKFVMLEETLSGWDIADTVELDANISSLCSRASCIYESSVFIRKYDGHIQIFYESADHGYFATGAGWNLRGYMYDGKNFCLIDKTESLDYAGSGDDPLWELDERTLILWDRIDLADLVRIYKSLDFNASRIGTGYETWVQDPCCYCITRIIRNTDLEYETAFEWLQSGTGELEGFWISIIDFSSEIPVILPDAVSYVPEAADEYEQDDMAEGIPDSEYILPDSDSKLISREQIVGMSSEDLRLARNEIFARHGRKFKVEDLQAYFNQKSWYTPEFDPDVFDAQMYEILNDTELTNIDLIMKQERVLE